MCLVSFDDRVSAVSVCGSGGCVVVARRGGVQEAEEMCVGVGDAYHSSSQHEKGWRTAQLEGT